MCMGHPCRNWSNVPKVQCTDEDQVSSLIFYFFKLNCILSDYALCDNCYLMLFNIFQNLILKSSERIYKLRSDDSVHNIISVNASGSIYVQPFQNMGEAHYHFVQYAFSIKL